MVERNAETQSGMLLDFCNVAANKTISPSQTNGSLVGFVDVLLADCETVHTAVGLGMIWTLPRLAVQCTVHSCIAVDWTRFSFFSSCSCFIVFQRRLCSCLIFFRSTVLRGVSTSREGSCLLPAPSTADVDVADLDSDS